MCVSSDVARSLHRTCVASALGVDVVVGGGNDYDGDDVDSRMSAYVVVDLCVVSVCVLCIVFVCVCWYEYWLLEKKSRRSTIVLAFIIETREERVHQDDSLRRYGGVCLDLPLVMSPKRYC